MKPYYLTTLAYFIAIQIAIAAPSTVYVSTTGNDQTGDGTLSQPYRTIQKASDVLTSGGFCYILGGTYRETIVVKYPNQTFVNYNNEPVVITGLDSLSSTGWTLYKDGIYQQAFSGFDTQFTELFADGAYMQMARYPDNTTGDMMSVTAESGYANCIAYNATASEGTRRVDFPGMTSHPTDHWAGGYFRGITGHTWMNPHGIIESSSGAQLTVNPTFKGWKENSENVDGHGWGFIFHLNALDRIGEWYWKNNVIYYKPDPADNMQDLTIEAKKRTWAFRTTKDNTSIKGLHIKSASIEIKASNCTVEETTIRYLYPYFYRQNYNAVFEELGGLYIQGNNNTYKSCYVAHSWGNGFSLSSGSGNTIENCVIDHIGWNAQFTSSVLTHGTNTTIKNCTMGATGRFHIRFQNKTNILYNDLYDCMKMGQDAGSIEATSGGAYATVLDVDGAEIAYNHIHDSNTLPKDPNQSDGKQFVVALYIEDVANYTVHHNLIWNFKTNPRHDGAFVYLGPRRTEIYDVFYYNNTVWNCDYRIRIWNRDEMGDIRDTKFYNNLMDGTMVDSDHNTVPLIPKIDFKNNIDYLNANDHFANPTKADFTLKSTSTAIDGGIVIPGITDGYLGIAPDIGAIEHGKEPWAVGANLSIDEFILAEDKGFGTIVPEPLPTSIPSLKEGANDTNLYPNPVTGQFLIIQKTNSTLQEVQILSLNGTLLHKQQAQGNEISLPIRDIVAEGAYLIRIISDLESSIHKIVVQ